nr:ABC transporter G family member 30-like [Dermatophagoides farinae]
MNKNNGPLNCEPMAENISLAWRNLSYQVSGWFGSGKKSILKRLNGHVTYGSMNAFLGPSGAGKTTMLNCLNGTLRSGITSDSEIYLNREERNQTPVIRFVEQHVHETIIARMTVREILHYAFRFKNPMSQWNRMNQHILSVLNELLLDKTILDNHFEKCSGGEQRRIAIAQELMSLEKPTFLFVDEPTTGLDSNAALLVTQCLRKLVNNSRLTILVSIHTPNSDTLALFDKVFVLAKGGVCIYSGPPNDLRNNLKQKIDDEFDTDKPTIEEYLDIACEAIGSKNVRKLTDSTLIEQHTQLDPLVDDLKFLQNGIRQGRKKFSSVDFILQFYRLMKITFVAEYQNFLIQYPFFFFLITVIASFYETNMTHANVCYSLESDDYLSLNMTCREKLYDEALTDDYRMHQMFDIVLISLSVLGMSCLFFHPILKVFRNEHRNQWYSLGTFFWAFLIVRCIELTILTGFIGMISYFSIDHLYVDNNQLNWNRFGNFLYFVLLNNFQQQSIGHLLCLIFLGQFEVSIVSSYIVITCQQFFTGYMFNPYKMKNIPSIFLQMSEILSFKTVPNGLMYTMYGLDRCDDETTISFVLDDFGVNVDTVYSDSYFMIINIVIIRFLVFVLMIYHFSGIFRSKRFVKASISDAIKCIDYGKLTNQKEEAIDLSKTVRIKKEDELGFEDFARHKIVVAWRSLTLFGTKSIYEIRSVEKEGPNSKQILKNLNGQFRFGTLNALMGPSGAGKTSLLNILIGKSKTRLSDSTVFYLSKFTPIKVCHLKQEVSSHLLPGLTAKQSLTYASMLKNTMENKNLDHEAIAMKILKELDLVDTKDTYVQNCSGGQRKRLALGLELTSIRMPNLICIDEPTSGLDSSSAQVVVSCLRQVAHHHNICIITSIHQPTAEVFSMFDQVYVLAKGGVCVYSGPPSDIRQHLTKVSDRMDQDDIFPVEELIKYSCLSYEVPSVQDLVRLTNERILNDNLILLNETVPVLDGIPTNQNRFSLKSVWVLILRYAFYVRGYLWQILVLMYCLYISFGISIYYIFDTNMIFRDGCVNMEDELNNTCNQTQEKEDEDFDLQASFIYICFGQSMMFFIVLLQTSIMFSKEIVYFRNEHQNGWYSTGAFYSMKMLIEFLPLIPALTIFTYLIDIYEPIHPGMFYWLLFYSLMGALAAQAFGHLVAIISLGKFVALIISIPAIEVISLLISNMGTPIRRLHYIFQFLSNFAPTRFTIEAILLLQYGFDRCRRKEVQKILLKFKMEENEHEFHGTFFYYTIIMLIFNIIIYRVIALLLLLAKTNRYENRRKRAMQIADSHQKLKPVNVIIPGLQCHHEMTIKQFKV